MEKMEKIQLIGSSSPYESDRASPTGSRRPLPFKRDLMGLSLSLSLVFCSSSLVYRNFLSYTYYNFSDDSVVLSDEVKMI
jgi:hypothetical protein